MVFLFRDEVAKKKIKEEIAHKQEEDEVNRGGVEGEGEDDEESTKEGRGAPEGRKSGIVRGQVITKKSYEGVVKRVKRRAETEVRTVLGAPAPPSASPSPPPLTLTSPPASPPPPKSRESAGEPDGKADSDEAELPISPRTSFLHSPNNITQLSVRITYFL